LRISRQNLTAKDSDHFGFTIEELKKTPHKRIKWGPRGNAKKVLCRQVAMFLIRKNTTTPLKKVGELFGGKHYSSVIHSCRKIRDLMTVYPDIKKTIEDLSIKIHQDNILR
jgi:chromosomal replication initiation ATPase DnaA